MYDAVIDEIDGRRIRIGSHWLTDFASCNYLGFDLDPEIMAAIDDGIRRWGTHPSWSRLLGNPRLYPQIEEQLTDLLARAGHPRPADHHAHPHVGDPASWPARARFSSTTRRTRRSTTDVCTPADSARRSRPFDSADPQHLDDLLRALAGAASDGWSAWTASTA